MDPADAVNEGNEANNIAVHPLQVDPNTLALQITTDKPDYGASEELTATVTLTNSDSAAQAVTLDLEVLDGSDNLLETLAAQDLVSVPPSGGGSTIVTYPWNTGTTLAGSYQIRAKLYEAGTYLGTDTTPFTILPSMTLVSSVTTDKIEYPVNASATLTAVIESTSTNFIFEDLTAEMTLTDGLGTPLMTEAHAVPALTMGQRIDFNSYWNTGTYPAGDYPVTLEVKDASGTVLSSATTTVTISSIVAPSELLHGEISLDHQSRLQGDPVAISYTVTNAGNMDLSTVDLSILTVHVVNETIHDTFTDQTGLLMGASYSGTRSLDTTNYSAKDYLVILRASISGMEETLAGTYFRIEGAPSAPSLNAPGAGEDVETLTPVLSINNASDPNDDRLTYAFELYEDPGLTSLVISSAMVSQTANTTSWPAPMDLTENATYFWRARAYDELFYGEWMTPASFRVNVANDLPTAPTPSSPAHDAEVDTLQPVLSVNNASDPDSESLTYDFEVAPDIDFTQISVSKIGLLPDQGTTSWPVPTALNDNTFYYWRAQADDWLDVGPWMTPARFFVNTVNDAPTTPAMTAPADGSEITALSVDITASNAADPDLDVLTYVFQTDTAPTFDSGNLIQSGNISEGTGTTSWDTGALSDNTHYFVRVKANDGLAESPWSEVVTFFVNTANDAPTQPTLANPSDGGAVHLFTPALSVYNGSDIDEDILTYEFELYEDAAMTTLVANEAGVVETESMTAWTVPVSLIENATYFWRARVSDGELLSDWMPPASFMVNTANDAPSAPVLVAPAEGSSLDHLSPILSVANSSDPDSDTLIYDFEVYAAGSLVVSLTGITEDSTGITSVTLPEPLVDDTAYTWRARAYDGDRHGAWMDMASFSIHLPVTAITATIDFDPNTLNQGSRGKWVVVYIELPEGYDVNDIDVTSILIGDTVPAVPWPYAVGDDDKDGIPDLMVKFRRADVISLLPAGDEVQVLVTGSAGTVTFEGVDVIRVIH